MPDVTGPNFVLPGGQQAVIGAVYQAIPDALFGKIYRVTSAYTANQLDTTQTYLAGFLQDNFQISSRFTVRAGVRWEEQKLEGVAFNLDTVLTYNPIVEISGHRPNPDYGKITSVQDPRQVRLGVRFEFSSGEAMRPRTGGNARPHARLAAPGMAALGLAALAALGSPAPAAAETDEALRQRAHAVHRRAIVIDTHADLTPLVEKDVRPAMIDDHDLAGPGYDASLAASRRRLDNKWLHNFPPGPWSFVEPHTTGYMDLPRMRAGGLDAQFFAVYTEEDDRPGMGVKTALSQIGAIRALAAKYPNDVGLAATARDVRDIVGSGRVALLMGVEGGHMIDDDLNVLRAFAALGVRYMAPTHSFNTHWADSSGVGPPVSPAHGGLSPFGREVVREMNRLGVLPDVSHVADKTFFDVLEVTKGPVIASHSAVDAIKEHARNMSDDMLRALARNGGVIQVDGVLKYIDPETRPQTPLSVYIDHIDHAIQVAGIDHVGLGMDFSPTAGAPVGLEDCSKYEAITYELLKRGYRDADVRKVLGENTLRIMEEAERLARASSRN